MAQGKHFAPKAASGKHHFAPPEPQGAAPEKETAPFSFSDFKFSLDDPPRESPAKPAAEASGSVSPEISKPAAPPPPLPEKQAEIPLKPVIPEAITLPEIDLPEEEAEEKAQPDFRLKKKMPFPVKLLIILLVIMLLLCGAVLALWLRGRQQMTSSRDVPQFTPPTAASTEAEEVPTPVTEASDPALEGNVISYKGKYYRYNEEITNILLIGVDGDSPAKDTAPHQADLLVLAALDRTHNRVTLISVPRDTMADIEILDDNGVSLGTDTLPIALSYAYGQTPTECCEMSREAVSSLFCGLPIHAYGAFYLDGVPTLNDLLGGVTVTIPNDENDVVFKDMPAGTDVRLNGEQARHFTRDRRSDRVDAAMLRLSRQKQYMFAMIRQAKVMLKEDVSQVLPLYRELEKYILTDLSISSISYLASEAIDMDINEDVISLEGELTLDDSNHAELRLDPESLYTAMLSVYYDEIPVGTP